jgi:hypothetical protein
MQNALFLFLGAAVIGAAAYLTLMLMHPQQNPWTGEMSANVDPNTGSGQGAQNTKISGLSFFSGTGLGGSSPLPAGFATGGVSPSTATPIGTATGNLGGWY